MIFSIIMALTNGLRANLANLSLLHAPFVLGLISGGAIIYWFTGASTQAVTTGAYRAVEFIKANIRLEGVEKASVSDSKKVVQICTQYAQKGMFNIFLAVFFVTLAFAFSAKTVASFHRERKENDLSRWVMEYAIERLQTGDRECQTRAAMLATGMEHGMEASYVRMEKIIGGVPESRTA